MRGETVGALVRTGKQVQDSLGWAGGVGVAMVGDIVFPSGA